MSRPTLPIVVLSAALLASSPALAKPPQDACGPGRPLAAGQRAIDDGRYEEAIALFSCVLDGDPFAVDAYRGRSEAELLLGRYSDAYHDRYALPIASMQPEDIDDLAVAIFGSYEQRLASPDVPALTGASFSHWVFWEYRDAIPLLDQLLEDDPNDVYASLFRGSSRLFAGVDVAAGEDDLDHAIALAPGSADVRYLVADAYTYALPDLERAYAEASLALAWGLDTPRVHAILAAALLADGDLVGAAGHLQRHLDLVTTSTADTAPLGVGEALVLDLEPGVTFQIPIAASAGQAIAIATGSPSWQIWDSVLVLLDPDGSPVVGSDDAVDYFAALDWVAPATGTYLLRVTSFEAVSTGPLVVTRGE